MKENEGLLNEISAHDVHHYISIWGLWAILLIAVIIVICRHRGYCCTRQRQSASTETPEEATESVAGPSAGLPPNSNNQSTEKCSENVSMNVRGYKDRVPLLAHIYLHLQQAFQVNNFLVQQVIVYDPHRNRLLGDKAAKLLFLKYNLPLLNFNYDK
ncbi:hypothetical protein ACJJTC_008075 [Scirpophaga incertulas]